MPNIKLLKPTSLDEALSHLSAKSDETKIISGGTALVIMLKNRLIAPATLLSLAGLQELRGIRHEPGIGLRIGALATIREAETSPIIREKQPILAQTFGKVGNIRVRHAATVGGNLSEADYASDPPCVLVALRARVKARSAHGEREIPLVDFFKGFYETALAPDEILTELIVPDALPETRAAYVKYVSRSSEDRPCVGMVIPGGENRVVALQNNQIDATLVQMGDWLNLDDKAPGRYHIIKTGNLFDISGASFWANVEWLRKNEDVAIAYVAELLKSFRMAHANPKILEPVVAKYLPDMPKSIIAPAIKAYLDVVRAWPQNGGDTSILDDTVKFFTASGELKTPVNTKEIVDSKILSSALAKVGRIQGAR